MNLKISNKIGPMLKPQHVFENEKSIAIGRDTSQCQVIYPPDFTTVGRKHLVIEEDAGRFELRVNTKNPVYLDGVLAEDDMELPDICTITLGVKDGPSFVVERVSNNELPKTREYGNQAEIHTQVKKSRNWLKVSLLLIIAVAVGFGYKASLNQNKIDRLEEFAGDSFKDIYKSIESDIGQVANSLSKSIYLVILKTSKGEAPGGTAWVAADGVFATNAHVAEMFNEIPDFSDAKLIVRANFPPYQEHVIDKVAIHPAYLEWEKTWKEASPRLIKPDGAPELADFVGGYDVALMYPTSSIGMAKPLKIASLDRLVKLSPGQQVAYIGFPMEQVINQVYAEPTPTIQIANITSITDFFRSQSTFEDSQLIQNSLPAAGGASGSPIINDKGEVIALLSSVNMVSDGNGNRTPNAVSINYGQRADLLQLLLKSGQDFPIDFIQSKWKEGFEEYAMPEKLTTDAIDHDAKTVLDYWKFKYSITQSTQLMHKELVINVDKKFMEVPTELVTFNAPKSGRYLVIAIDEDKNDIAIIVTSIENNEIYGTDSENTYYPFSDFELEDDDEVEVLVLFPTMEQLNIESTKVHLYIYHD